MTSRPDLLAIDMKRQGRFGLCIPLFPAQGPDDVSELFSTIARSKKIQITIRCRLCSRTSRRPAVDGQRSKQSSSVPRSVPSWRVAMRMFN